MASDPNEFVPPFISSLTHDQHARIGRIAVLWGQIDLIVDQLLQLALGITGEQRQIIIGEKPIGAKLDMINRSWGGLKHEDGKALAKEFCDLAHQTKTHRNKCFHGVWGFRTGTKKNEIYPAAGHFKSMDDPLRATQLPALEKKLCKTARVGFQALVLLHEFPPHPEPVRLFHGKPGDYPEWLPEWSKQHPLDDRALDHNWKLGQLPYLKHPL